MRIIQGINPEIKPQTIFHLLGYNGKPKLSIDRFEENFFIPTIYWHVAFAGWISLALHRSHYQSGPGNSSQKRTILAPTLFC